MVSEMFALNFDYIDIWLIEIETPLIAVGWFRILLFTYSIVAASVFVF